ncbi:MAG: hypothetical protein NUV63_12765 [Gallionella sp.]|nr:hypothetical protein [Gallionella sp.]
MIEKPKEFDRIWLQTCGDSMSEWYGEITWCHDKVNDDDVEYVSAKLYAEQAAQMNTAMDERIAAGVRIVELEQQRDELMDLLEGARVVIDRLRTSRGTQFLQAIARDGAMVHVHALIAAIDAAIAKVKQS